MNIDTKTNQVLTSPVAIAGVILGALCGFGVAFLIAQQVTSFQPWAIALSEQLERHRLLYFAIGFGIAGAVGFNFIWRTAPDSNITRRLTFALLISLLLGGAAYNLAIFKETNRGWAFGIKRNKKETLASMIARSADKYNGIEVLEWFRLHAAGSVLYASPDTIGKSGLAPHRMAGIALVQIQELAASSPEALRQARLSAVNSSDWPRLKSPSNIEMRIAPNAAHPRAKLCAWMLSETVVLVTSAELPTCGGGAL